MKKTFIALTVASLFSASAMAAAPQYDYNLVDIAESIVDNSDSYEVESRLDGRVTIITDKTNGEKIAVEAAKEDGKYHVTDVNGGETNFIEVDSFGNVVKIDGEDVSKIEGNGVIIDTDDVVDTIDASAAAVERVKSGETNVEVRDGQGNVLSTIDSENVDHLLAEFDLMNDEQKVAAMKQIKAMNESGQIVEGNTPKPRPEPEPINDDARMDWVNDRINGAAGAIANEGVKAYSDLDSRIAGNTKRIDSLEQDMVKMGNKMLDLEDRMDGVVATSHAVTNARPMVQDAGEFAMGVGMGAAGSKQAVAFGGAYQFNTNWSASTTVNYETAGKRSKSQLSAGAGVQYRFK